VEAAGDAQLGVEREQQRQPGRAARVLVILEAGIPPAAAQARVGLPVLPVSTAAGVWCRKRPKAWRQKCS
jgi:hypothetical protein